MNTSKSLSNTGSKIVLKYTWKTKLAFWILGLNNQFGCAVILTAAKDITFSGLPEIKYVEKPRFCSLTSTGSILLLITAPALVIQICSKWFKNENQATRAKVLITFSMFLTILGYIMLAYTENPFISLPGVFLISIGYGMGDFYFSEESLILKPQLMDSFTKFQQGTQDALIIGSIIYTAYGFFGYDLFYFFICLSILPSVALILFWTVLVHTLESPKKPSSKETLSNFQSMSALAYMDSKGAYVMHLLKSYLPLSCMIFLNGVINQGFYEFIYFRTMLIDHLAQYRIYIAIFNMGTYACLKTKTLLLVNYVVICTGIHIIAAGFFISDGIFCFTGQFWMILLAVYLQGINFGIAYTSQMRLIKVEEPLHCQDLAAATLKNLQFVLPIFSGVACFGVHYFLARMPERNRP